MSDADIGNISAGAPDMAGITGSLPAANFSTSSLGTLGTEAGGVMGALKIAQDPTNPVNDIQGLGSIAQAYQAATGGAGAASSTISAAAPYLGVAGAAAAMAYSDYQMMDPANIPDTLKGNIPGSTVGKLPSGNSVLNYNGIGVGLGTQQSEGSGEIYQNGKWIGQKASGGIESAYDQLVQAQKGYTVGQTQKAGSSGTTTGTGLLAGVQVAKGVSGSGSGIASQAANATTKIPLTAAQQKSQEAEATTSMMNIYTSTGGQKTWGQSGADWLADMTKVLGNINEGTEWARQS